MRKNAFKADKGHKDSICIVCGETIPIGALRIKIQGYHKLELYHFKCYTPKVKQYICKTDVKMHRLDPENTAILNNWLEEWNKNYMPLDKPFSESPKFSKLVESNPSKYRRAWLEIFKFLDAIEVFKHYSYVNKEFYHISWDQELWHFFCNKDYPNTDLYNQENNFRSQYIILYNMSCFWCHTPQSESDYKRCPLVKKPICANCKKLPRFKYMCKEDIKNIFGINPNILQLTFGEGSWGNKVVYRYMAEEAVEKFRRRNKEFLLEEMKKNNSDPKLIGYLENIDINNIDCYYPNALNLEASLMPMYTLIYSYVRDKTYEKRLLSKIINNK